MGDESVEGIFPNEDRVGWSEVKLRSDRFLQWGKSRADSRGHFFYAIVLGSSKFMCYYADEEEYGKPSEDRKQYKQYRFEHWSVFGYNK